VHVSLSTFTESVVERAALAWLESLGWTVKHGPDIGPGELAAERSDYAQVVLTERLRQALARLNPALPPEALDDPFRKLTRPEGAALEAHNHATMRDGLLPRLISGELRVRDAERIVDAAI